jgi:hypothetical protein
MRPDGRPARFHALTSAETNCSAAVRGVSSVGGRRPPTTALPWKAAVGPAAGGLRDGHSAGLMHRSKVGEILRLHSRGSRSMILAAALDRATAFRILRHPSKTMMAG